MFCLTRPSPVIVLWGSAKFFMEGNLRLISALIGLALLPQIGSAIALDWSGLYRVEALRIKNSELDKVERNKSYINHHLVLKPRAVVADGLNIYSRFDVFNDATFGANSQFGQFFGSGVGDGGASSDDTDVLSQNQASESLLVNELYLTYDFEFASLLVGRAPLHFGTGLTHNGGNGLFDHWFDNRDMAAMEFVMGNLKFRPIFGKVSEGTTDIGDDVRDYMFQLDYDNAETDTGLGVFYQIRRSGLAGNDIPASLGAGGVVEGFEGNNINFYLRRGWETFRFAVEGGFAKGKTGLRDADGIDISRDGFGIALQLDYQAKGSRWHWDLKTGLAGGDDPSTTDKLEGFYFDRNYDVGLLLFNHVLGQFDVLASSLARDTTLGGNAGAVPDMESVSNTLYIAPGFQHQWKEKWSWGGRFIYATLNETNLLVNGAATEVESDLGFELDFNLTFKPHDRLTWVTETGLLFPGAAFEGGGNFDSEFAYGIVTKAAISF